MTPRVAVATLLTGLALVLHLTLARAFDRLDVYEQTNVFFDADIKSRLQSISAGKHLGIKHPNLMPYFTPPIALAAKVITQLHPSWGPEPTVQRALGVLVIPVASALKTMLVFLAFCHLGFSLAAAAVATVLEMVSFTTLIFGTIPESYGLTALALAMMYAYAARSRDNPPSSRRQIVTWVALGVFATGITVTNIAFVGLLLWAALWYADARLMTATVRAAIITLAIFGVTGVSAYFLDWALVEPDPAAYAVVGTQSQTLNRVAHPFKQQADAFHLASDPAEKLRRFPTSVANALAPSALQTKPISSRAQYNFGFTLERSSNIFGRNDPFGLSLFLIVVTGAACLLATPSTRPIAAASIGIFACCWMLSVWGAETQLYSQHWQLATVVLIAGVMTTGRWERPLTALLAVLTVIVAGNNLRIMREIFSVLAASRP